MIFCNELTIDGQGQICLAVCFPLLFTVVDADPPASQNTLENPSLAGALQFCRSRNSFSQGKPLDHTCRMVEGLDAVWANFCPSKPRLPSFIGGKKQVGQPLPWNQKYSEVRPGYDFGCWLDRSFWISLLHWLCVQVLADPPCGTASGSYRPQCVAPYPPLIYPPTAEPLPVNFFSIKSIVVLICPPTAEPLPPLPPARHQAGGVFLSIYEILSCFL